MPTYALGFGLSLGVLPNALGCTVVRVPKVTLVRFTQFTKALYQITLTPGATTLVRAVLFANAPSPIRVTLLGAVIEVSALQPSNM